MSKSVWILAFHPMCDRRLWGLTVLERNVRLLASLGVQDIVIVADRPANPLSAFHYAVPQSVRLSVLSRDQVDVCGQEAGAPAAAGGILLLAGHGLYDARLLRKLLAAATPLVLYSTQGERHPIAAYLDPRHIPALQSIGADGLGPSLQALCASGGLTELDLSDFDPYVHSLRRRMPPFAFLIENNAQIAEADTILRHTAQKGVNDFVARYIHPPLEFAGTRILAATRITPNQVTLFWIALGALVIPLFARGNLLAGCVLAVVCGVLDGVDGKLARLTLRFSQAGDWLDHVTNTLYDALWYFALGWYFSVEHLHPTAETFTAILLVAYVVERIVPGVFKHLHGIEIYDYADVDRWARLVGSRMNNNIWLITLAVIAGRPWPAFQFVSLWMLSTATWHIARLVYVTATRRRKQPSLAH